MEVCGSVRDQKGVDERERMCVCARVCMCVIPTESSKWDLARAKMEVLVWHYSEKQGSHTLPKNTRLLAPKLHTTELAHWPTTATRERERETEKWEREQGQAFIFIPLGGKKMQTIWSPDEFFWTFQSCIIAQNGRMTKKQDIYAPSVWPQAPWPNITFCSKNSHTFSETLHYTFVKFSLKFCTLPDVPEPAQEPCTSRFLQFDTSGLFMSI